MAVTYITLKDETGTPLRDDAGLYLLVFGEETASQDGGAGRTAGSSGKGQNFRLWDIFQEEMALRHRPKPKPQEIALPPPEPYQPAPPSGFFDATIDPEVLALRARAMAEAADRQRQHNAKMISDLLRKAARSS